MYLGGGEVGSGDEDPQESRCHVAPFLLMCKHKDLYGRILIYMSKHKEFVVIFMLIRAVSNDAHGMNIHQ